jgi:hypothetical protein
LDSLDGAPPKVIGLEATGLSIKGTGSPTGAAAAALKVL